MFDIEYKGGNAVVVSTKKTSIVFDPKLSVVGLKDIVLKDGVQAATEDRFCVSDEGYRLTINGPGEFEIADVSLRGIATKRHIDTDDAVPAGTAYQFEIGGVRAVVLGNIAPKLSEEQLEEIGVVDIAILPVGGGGYTLDATSAASLVRQIDPKIVIPIHYADSGVTYEVPQDSPDVFTGELGAPVENAGNKLKIKSASSLPDVLTVTTLDRG